MATERDYALNAKVSYQAAIKLKKLSMRRNMSYGEVLDALLLEVPIEAAEWEQPLQQVMERLNVIEAKIAEILTPEPVAVAPTEPVAVGPKESMASVIQELVKQNMTPQHIADELNRRGYRTATGTEIKRGHRSIINAIKQQSQC